jgi:drug/metabolite transporter (DMT)-like permease
LNPVVERNRLGYGLAACAAILLSTIGVLGKIAYSFGADPLALITLRAFVATGIVGVTIALTNVGRFKIKPRDIPFFVAFGIFGVSVNYLGYFYALRLTTVATTMTLLYTYPTMVVVVAFFIFHEPITSRKVAALVLTFTGVLVTAFGLSSSRITSDMQGLIFGLLGGVGTAIYTLAAKKGQVSYSALTVLFYSFLFGALTLGGFYFLQYGCKVDVTQQVMAMVLLIAFVPTLMGYGLYTLSLRFIEAGKSSITLTIAPGAAIILAYLFIGESVAQIQLLGTALIVSGVIILQLKGWGRLSSHFKRQ